jgi:hypothetical protein
LHSHRLQGATVPSISVHSPGLGSRTSLRLSWAKLLELLLYPQDPVLCGLGNPKFDDGLGWNLDLLLRLWIKTRARFPLLLHELAKTGKDKFAVLFNLFVGERAKSIQEYSRGSFVGLGGFGKCGLKFCLGHL